MNGDRQPPKTSITARSSGFTLIELLIVISIIALLIGLLVPAVMAVMRRARDAEVRVEIANLDKAITAFQAEYGGIAPPSSITFYANAAGYDGDPRSKAIIRRIWPQFNFATNGGGAAALVGELNGAECLVFFLGGVVDSSGALIGFSKNPARPFATTGGRAGPFFEFNAGRITSTGSGTSGNINAPEYFDPLSGQTNPYVYLSSYDGNGYRLADVTALSTTLTSWYKQPDGTAAIKPNSHQIISPGVDGKYGNGGVYDGKKFTVIPANPDDEDNITNFSPGRLTP